MTVETLKLSVQMYILVSWVTIVLTVCFVLFVINDVQPDDRLTNLIFLFAIASLFFLGAMNALWVNTL